ncbi:uncharacterized protein BT62DRAFT_1003128 [Guyanagaster necrorhizus]|uniref:Uncharacterized protein n=1 Tax=Guyanagaster necrorhizus TaxID=856835 RepID=A0A9P7VXR9_9AGAR|nr:uncharacterized protein BT62DRAFT_1003128 [Guyanagaster necrorhizus MCA 3950]KAG7448410.1 hypothetical protein BT62DRAFT_1003128 [Guyanagaster necrorhizus MCA 3950]
MPDVPLADLRRSSRSVFWLASFVRWVTPLSIGCVVAGRLAYADPTLKVMLIEGGANNRDDPWVYRLSYGSPDQESSSRICSGTGCKLQSPS